MSCRVFLLIFCTSILAMPVAAAPVARAKDNPAIGNPAIDMAGLTLDRYPKAYA